MYRGGAWTGGRFSVPAVGSDMDRGIKPFPGSVLWIVLRIRVSGLFSRSMPWLRAQVGKCSGCVGAGGTGQVAVAVRTAHARGAGRSSPVAGSPHAP